MVVYLCDADRVHAGENGGAGDPAEETGVVDHRVQQLLRLHREEGDNCAVHESVRSGSISGYRFESGWKNIKRSVKFLEKLIKV